jgi:hypothetical protein
MRILIVAVVLILSCVLPAKNEATYVEGSYRGSLFFPTSGRCSLPFWSPFFQLETNFHFAEPWRAIPWTGFANIGLAFGLGHYCNQHRAVWFPISGGLRYSWCIGEMRELSIGLGGTISWFHSKGSGGSNDKDKDKGKDKDLNKLFGKSCRRHSRSGGRNKKGVGLVVKTSWRQYSCDTTFREFFIDYTYNPNAGLRLNGFLIGIACGRIF